MTALKVPLSTKQSLARWERSAQKSLERILCIVETTPALRARGPRIKPWQATLIGIGMPQMVKLNGHYRGKQKATDILSFSAVGPFRDQGILGELVICLPVLRSQARLLKHSEKWETAVLLVHGVLHLLNLDHERGGREARLMARWEAKLLAKLYPTSPQLGLIKRTCSDMEES